ncbi:MAG: hypothetical protein KDB00_08225 [Planctomycetales bacterium]|nr:hypothetical protein [Planctomycetales bacterium]
MPRSAFFLFVLLTVPLIVGCEGCRPVTPKEGEGEEDDKAPKEAYSTNPAIVYPADQSETLGLVKPGHWMTAEQPIQSNKADTRGELISRTSLTLKSINLENTGTIEGLDSVRPVVLPKGQMRRLNFRFLCPVPNSVESKRISLASRLIPRSGGIMDTGGQFFNIMQGNEYFFVVLTKRPERFARLQVADWVLSSDDQIMNPYGRNYRVVIPDTKDLISLPETMLDLTSTGVVLWDDLSENALTIPQQTALADWVRFGGRLIINGPDASEAIANTTLADLLPLIPTSNIELDGDAAASLLESHSVATDRTVKSQVEMVKSDSSRIAIDGQIDNDAIAVENTASLILQRRVGRGHVVQPRFDLTDNWIESWDSYNSFFNSVILNRPPRRYVEPNSMSFGDSETEGIGFDANELSLFFVGTTSRADAAVNTQFRIAARDSLLYGGTTETKANSPFDPYSRIDAITGVASWNDTSDAIALMRETLTGEAGIEIPGSSLVIRSLAIYLVVLVPINYIVFRLMNRLEYAWFAVPVIAVVGAAWAARQARLDIGFARSNTELGLVEVHAGYPRAHLTRMIGIYNSLSSRYELQFATVDGIASPLLDEPDPNTSIQPLIRTSFEEGPSLADFAVNSNRMRYVHCEEMVDLGGVVKYDGASTLTSDMGVELLDGIVVRKGEGGKTEIAAIGSLSPGETKTIEFRETDRMMVSSELPMQTSRMIRRFATPDSIPNGSTRLVARIDGALAGLAISPSASQQTAQTVAIVHLKHAPLPAAQPDKNLVTDFRRVNRIDQTTTKDADDKATTETNPTEKE